MTARERWKKWYRLVRICRREHKKVMGDLMVYGTGVLKFPMYGEPEHIPLKDFWETTK